MYFRCQSFSLGLCGLVDRAKGNFVTVITVPSFLFDSNCVHWLRGTDDVSGKEASDALLRGSWSVWLKTLSW